jgi:molybdopterin converting factor small subunit
MSGVNMETVRVTFYSWTASPLGQEGSSELTLELPVAPGGTLKCLLDDLAGRYPLFGRDVYDVASARITQGITLFLNGRSLNSDQALETELKGGDLMAFLPIIEGG